jgi:catechol 2,3-dioxygenase-like lactoylglutathione lyase family enzyme
VPITTGFNHVATLTTDLDRFAAWYGDVFGAEVVHTMDAEGDHPRMFIIDMGGGSALNVFEVPPESIIGERRRIGGRGAIDHFGIAVDSLPDLERIKERLVTAGADIGEIQRLGDEWSLFFRDVDGTELEVCCQATS